MSRISVQLLIALLLVGCGGGGGGTSTSPAPSPPQVSNTSNAASARLSIRTTQALPGAVTASTHSSAPNPILALFSSPAWAQSFFTLPGARVDALGVTFAIADGSGVAEFLTLPPRDYRFVVTTSNPGVILQTLLVAQPGANIQETINEFTSIASLLAASAANDVNTTPAGADLEAIVSLIQSNQNTELNLVKSLVQTSLAGGSSWLDNEKYLPLPGTNLDSAVRAANSVSTYRLNQVPYKGQQNYPSTPIILAITFNNPIDTSTLATESGGNWSLSTPGGQISSSNLSAFGTVNYTATGTSIEGRAILPNTLYFRLTGIQLTGNTANFTLSLPSLPKDIAGRTILSSTPPSAFVTWTFNTTGQSSGGAVTTNSEGSLILNASACNGPTNADLSPIDAPSLLLTFATPNSFQFQYQHVQQPFRVPSTERVFQLEISDPDTIQVGETYTISPSINDGIVLFYEERDYLSANQAPETRRWEVTSGTVTVTKIESGRVEVGLDAELEPILAQNGASGAICLNSTLIAILP